MKHIRHMTKTELVMLASNLLPRRYERRFERGQVRLLGSFGESVVLRITTHDNERHHTYISIAQYRTPEGYRHRAVPIPPPDWAKYHHKEWSCDNASAGSRLVSRHIAR